MNQTTTLSKKVDVLRINSWVEIKMYSPIDLERVYFHAQQFEANRHVPILLTTLEWAKGRLTTARGSLDMMIQTLIQVLHDKSLISAKEDAVILLWLKDDLGRYMQFLDQSEQNNLIREDSAIKSQSKIGIAKLSAYCRDLKLAYDSVYEVLLKSLREYYSIELKEGEERDKNKFLYIMFTILSLSLSFLGGITRNPGAVGNKGVVARVPTSFGNSWELLSSDKGKEKIRETYERQTGDTLIDIPQDMLEENPTETIIEENFENA